MSEINWEKEIQIYETESADAGKMKRRAAINKLVKMLIAEKDSSTINQNDEKYIRITRTCCRGLEDKSEGVRELSIKALSLLVSVLDASVLQYVLPSVACRIGLDEVAEESEILRLQLLELAMGCLRTFPNDVSPLGYLDYYTVLLNNCLKDPFPDLKREACTGAVTLCEIEPKKVKHASPTLAKTIKLMCLQHKHSSVRADAVNAFGVLCNHGAHEILGDTKDEQDNRTSVYYLYVLCNDQSESVRLATIKTLSTLLLDITERYDQHRRLIPHLLLLLTDSSEKVRLAANTTMLNLGKLFMHDNEDNTADLSKRRVTMKDIESYAAEEEDKVYPDMASWLNSCPFDSPGDWLARPMIGARFVVADCCRQFVENLLKDVTVLDWMIPYSSVNKRVAALRILTVLTFYIENDAVQYAPQVLQTLYKVLQDDNKEIVQHSHFAVEMLGKFLTPEQFLPFLVPVNKPPPTSQKSSVAEVDDEVSMKEAAAGASPTLEETGDLQQERKGNKVVTKQSVGTEGQPMVMPTLFSSAALVTKTSVLIAFRYFLLGSKATLQAQEALIIVKALCQMDVSEIDSSPLLRALIDVIVAAVDVLAARHLVCTPENPMPEKVKNDTSKHMHDSKLLYALLCLRSCEDRSVVAYVDAAAKVISNKLTGSDTGLFDLHFGRLLVKHQAKMPVDAFEALINNASDIGRYADPLVGLFLDRLTNVNYTLRITGELQYFTQLRSLLESRRMKFSNEALEAIVRSIVVEHGGFHPGAPAHLFRKLAMSTLRVLLSVDYRAQLSAALNENNAALAAKMATVWLSGVDADDGEMRLAAIVGLGDVWQLPLNEEGLGADVRDHSFSRLDDANEQLRKEAVVQMTKALTGGEGQNEISSNLHKAIAEKIVPTVKSLLLHMDDHVETVGLKEAVAKLLTIMGKTAGFNKDIIIKLTNDAMASHTTPRYCKQVVEALTTDE